MDFDSVEFAVAHSGSSSGSALPVLGMTAADFADWQEADPLTAVVVVVVDYYWVQYLAEVGRLFQ